MAGLCDANSRANKTMDYAGAVFHAKAAYDDIVAAAGGINVQIEPQSRQADYKAKDVSGAFVDEVDLPAQQTLGFSYFRTTSTRKSPRPRGWSNVSASVLVDRTFNRSSGSPSRARSSSS